MLGITSGGLSLSSSPSGRRVAADAGKFALALAIGLVLALAPSGSETAAQEVSAPGSASTATVDKEWALLWQDDIRYLARELPRRHPDPFAAISREELEATIDRLIEAVPEQTNAQIVVGLAELVARMDDGHSRVALPLRESAGFFGGHSKTPEPTVPGLEFGHLPIRLWIYSDGLFVQRAASAHADLAGLEVLRIGDLSAEDAMAAVAAVVHHDNEQQLQLNLADYLVIPEVLQATGVIAELGAVPFTFGSADGGTTTATLEPVSPRDEVSWKEAFDAAATPLYLRHPERKYWLEYLESERAVYFQLNEVGNEEQGETLEQFSERLLTFIQANPVDRLILDLRWNRGGDNGLNHPLIHGLIRSAELQEVGSLFAIVGRATFSAAMMLTLDLERHTPVLFVGEPTGSRPNHFGDSRKLTLPHSGITVRLSLLYWQYSDPRDERNAVLPHLEASLSSADYASGQDPALEAILALGAPSPDAEAAAPGDWAGRILFFPEAYDVVLHLTETDGSLSASLDIPAEEALGIPLENVATDGDTLTFVLTAFGDPITFTCRLHGNRMLAVADFGRRPAPFLLTRSAP